ncbi:MAG: cysteine desulfurase [Elusimicrobia bacterium]|nr:cysteine desulfurase [Elusimicrobiota bacterium]
MPLDVEKIRRDFPILGRAVRGKPLVYLDNAATTQKPRQVVELLAHFYGLHNANIHRGVHTLSGEATKLVDRARGKIARFINAPKPQTIVFTRNTTEAINLVARAWGERCLKAGDEILLTDIEHHSNLVPWQMLAQRAGAKLCFVESEPDGTLSAETARRHFTARTRIFAFTALSNALGSVSPVGPLAALAREYGALSLVDGAQWVPHRPTDVQALGCDFLAFSAHKMFGPTGVGVLYGREDLLEAMDPFLGGGDMISEVWLDRATYNELPYKFEAGTPDIGGIIAFGAAVDYLAAIGFEDIGRHERLLSERLLDILRCEAEVAVYGPRRIEDRGGVVSFNVGDVHPHDVGQIFDAEGVAIRVGHHCCQPLMRKLNIPGTARASVYAYNTLPELEAFAKALRKAKEFFRVTSAR